ncbi:MAG: PKD domain-containing protein [Methanospirillaceae archaeon]|nr:PKD domain-containing protein [Methanospirillaceae archaeon]
MMRKERGIGIIVAVAMFLLFVCSVSGALNPSFTVDRTAGNVTVTPFEFLNTSWPDEEVTSSTLYFDYENISGNNLTWRSSNPNITRTYEQDGNFTVKLLLENGAPEESAPQYIHVYPEADFDRNCTGFTGVATGHDVEFTNESILFHPDVFNWDFRDGTNITTEDAIHHWTSSGIYDINFTVVNDADGGHLQDSIFETIYVYDKPVATFNITPPAGSGVPVGTATDDDGWGNFTQTTFTLHDHSTDEGSAPQYEWYVYPNGTPMGTTPGLGTKNQDVLLGYFDYDGEYNVTHYVNNTTLCGGLSDPVTHKIYLTPYANFTYNTSTNVAVGQHILFTNTSSIGSTSPGSLDWIFEFGDPATSSDESLIVNVTTTGTGVASLNITNTTSHLFGIRNVTFTAVDIPYFSFNNTTLLEGVMPLNVTFLADDKGTTAIDTWSWNFGDTVSGTGQNPTHEYAAAGTYTVTLTGENQTYDGAVNSTQKIYNLTAKQGLSVSFNGSPRLGVYDLNVTFNPTVTGDGPITSCFWQFGDGDTETTSGVQPVTHEYTGPLDYATYYTVNLTATSPYDVESHHEDHYIYVGIPVTANFTHNYVPAVPPVTVTFTDTSTGSGIDGRSWTFAGGDPATSTARIVNVEYQTGGIYTINLTANNSTFNDSDSVQRTLEIYNITAPTASFTMTPDRGIAPAIISFNGSSSTGTPPLTYAWTFGDQSGSNPGTVQTTHTYANPGTYYPTLTVTNAYGQDASALPISIGQTIDADFSYVIVPLSDGQWPVNFTDESTGSVDTWFWQFGDGYSSTQQHPQHIYYDTANFTVTLTASSSYYGISDQKQRSVVIEKKPYAQFTVSPDPPIGETPLTLTFTDTSANNPTAWFWNFGDGETSNIQFPIHTYTRSGPFNVTLTAINEYGTDTSPATPVYPYERLVAAFTANPMTGVKPLDVTFTDTSLGNPGRWEWEFGDQSGFTGQNPPVHTYSTQGQYVVNLTVYKDNYLTDAINTLNALGIESISIEQALEDTTSRTITVTETAPPVVTFIATTPITGAAPLTVSFQDTTDPAQFKPIEWLWEFGDGAMSTQQNPTHTYEKPGMYTVVLSVKNAAGISRAANPVYIAVTEAGGSFGVAEAELTEENSPAEEPVAEEETTTDEEPDIPAEG